MTERPAAGAPPRARIFRPAPAPSRPAGAPTNSIPASSAARTAAGSASSASQLAIDLMREMLELPDTPPHRHRPRLRHRRVRNGDVDDARRARPVTTLAWESFGEGWVTDAVKQLKLDPTVIRADYGALPDLDQVDWSNDVLFTWNGTTIGRARSRRRVDRRRPRGPELRRRDQRGVRLRHRLGQDRCRDLQLAEGARRRRRARRADPRARARSSGSKASRPTGRCPRSSA